MRAIGRTGVAVSRPWLGAMMFGARGNIDHDESDVLDRIDEIVTPGMNLNAADGAWQSPAPAPERRRRPA